MKKQFIAKLVTLGLVLAMLPTAAFAAKVAGKPSDGTPYYWDAENKTYYYFMEDTAVAPDVDPEPAPSEGTEPAPVVETVEAEVAEDGSAAVEVSAAVIESLIAKADEDTGVVVLSVAAEDATKVSVAVPAELLVKLAAETGADLTVESAVASVTLSNEALSTLFEGVETVEIVAEAKADGTIEVAVLADGEAVEEIPGGLTVAIPVELKAEDVAGVYLVAADGTETELDWEIVEGKLQVTVTAAGAIRVDKK